MYCGGLDIKSLFVEFQMEINDNPRCLENPFPIFNRIHIYRTYLVVVLSEYVL